MKWIFKLTIPCCLIFKLAGNGIGNGLTSVILIPVVELWFRWLGREGKELKGFWNWAGFELAFLISGKIIWAKKEHC